MIERLRALVKMSEDLPPTQTFPMTRYELRLVVQLYESSKELQYEHVRHFDNCFQRYQAISRAVKAMEEE